MTSELTFIIPGPPVPKQRPRFGRGGRVYTPPATRDYEIAVRVQVIADTLLQFPHVWKAAIRFALPDDLAIVGDHKDAASSGLQ